MSVLGSQTKHFSMWFFCICQRVNSMCLFSIVSIVKKYNFLFSLLKLPILYLNKLHIP